MSAGAPERPPLSPPIVLTDADVPAVADLYRRAADYFVLQDGAPPDLTDAQALFTDLPPGKTPGDQLVLGWRSADALDAVAAILRDYPQKGIWYLGFLLVDARRRRQGLGRAAYAAIQTRASQGGATEIRLAVLEANPAAARFWRSLGFRERRRVGPDIFKHRHHSRIELNCAL